MAEAPPSPPPPAAEQRAPGRGMAVAALVLGICGGIPCVGFLPGMTAVVLAIVVLAMKRPGRNLAIAGLVLGVVLPAAWAVGWTALGLREARHHARRVISMTNLKALGSAISMYATDHRDFLPRDLDVLAREAYIGGGLLSSPATDGPAPRVVSGEIVGRVDYVYVRPAARMRDIANPATTLIAYEPIEHWDGKGTVVLFADGNPEWLSAEQFEKVRARLKPWTPPDDR